MCVIGIRPFWVLLSQVNEKTINGMVVTFLFATNKKLCGKSKVKTKLITFFGKEEIIHKEFVPASQIVNATIYSVVLIRLLEHICHVRSQKIQTGNWMLLHDNTPSDTSIIVHQFLTVWRNSFATPTVFSRSGICWP